MSEKRPARMPDTAIKLILSACLYYACITVPSKIKISASIGVLGYLSIKITSVLKNYDQSGTNISPCCKETFRG